MENRLKVRLTGAAILVALIVLVVPEMFRGTRSAGPAGASEAVGGPPVHSYTINLTDTATRPNSQEATPSAAQDATAGPSAAVAPAARVPGAQVPAAAAAAPASPVGAVDAQSPQPLEAPAASEPTAAHVGTAAAARAAQAHPEMAAAAPAGWSVQLGVFEKGHNAQRLTRTARTKGFSVRISRLEPKGLYRVWIAGLADRSAAERMSRKLHAAGLPAAIMRPR